MKLKKIIIITLFLSLLLIGTVSATDLSNDSQTDDINEIDESSPILKTEHLNLNTQINEDEISINDAEKINTELIASSNNETLATSEIIVNDYSQLYNQIENLKEHGTSKSYIINLNPKGDFAITDTIILRWDNSPAKDFTINGNGVTIDGKNSKAFMSIYENYNVTINNLNFVDNSRSTHGGGAIAVFTGGELNVNNCNFTGCKALNETESIHAGALRIGFDAIVRINNSIFKKNSATYGAGAIVIGGTLTDYSTSPHPELDPTTITPTAFINNCQFIDNTAGHGGAINIEDYSSGIIVNCTFKGNSALALVDGLGGGICTDMKSYAIVINSTFQDNTAKQSGGGICTDVSSCLLSINNTFQNNIAGHSGGGVYNAPKSQMQIENNIFINNQAIYGGGVCNHDDTTLTVTDSIFIENKAAQGGGIHNTNYTSLLINNSKFSKNAATEGGAISNLHDDEITISDCEFNKNNATTGGAISNKYDNEITIVGCEFNNNIATGVGGALNIGNNNNMVIKNINMIDNSATSNGGAIHLGKNTNIVSTNITFNSNKANSGGAICIDDNSNITAENILFTQNTATANGGAIYTSQNNNIEIKNTKITNNIANTNGGAIYIGKDNTLTLTNTTFSTNKATLGGAICLSANSDMNTDKTTFTQNTATKNGGAIYSENNNRILIKNTKLINNIATANGGAIITGENTKITLANATSNKNKAKIGGTICLGTNSNITADETPFTQNSAEYGGAIYTSQNNNIEIKNTKITDNSATVAGGAIVTGENNTLTTSNTQFNKNNAGIHGGAIFSGTNFKITTNNTSFTQNTATTNGGAINTGKANTLTLTNTTFNKNKATLGGAICLDANSKITADETTFTQNNATKNGGVIYSTNDNNILMRNVEITENLATTNGGAIYTGKTTTITASNTRFNKNNAGNLGGVICSDSGSTIELANSEFEDNRANTGNAIYNSKQSTLIFKGTTSIDKDNYVNIGELKVVDTVNTKISIDSVEYSSGIVVEGKLVDEYDSPISSETVSVSVENENVRANTDNNGKFIAIFGNINPGTYKITATYPGNSNYNKATDEITKKVVDRQPSRITASDITTIYNVEKDLVITLVSNQNSPLTKTQITVDLGTGAKTYATDANGQVKISTKDLTTKAYVAKIRFDGDENYLPSNTTAKITINKQTTTLTAQDITTTYNTNKDFVVTLTNSQNNPLTNTPITITLGTDTKTYTTDTHGQVKISTNSLATDTYNVKIKYKGDENYEQTNTTAKITINKQTTHLIAQNMTITYNKNEYLLITLKNEQNNVISDEMITVTIRTSIAQYPTDKNGQIKISTDILTPDTYDAKIKYNGNENYMQSNTTTKITVNKDASKIAITHADNELTFTFTNSQNSPLTDMPLIINLGKGNEQYKTNANGQVKISTKDFAPNTYTITAKYPGNVLYLPSNTTTKITISKETTTKQTTKITTTYANNDLTITLTNNQNSPLTDMPLIINLGKGNEQYKTNANGQVKISTKDFAPNTYTITAKYNGNEKYLPSNTTTKITITKQTTKITATDITTTYNTNKDFIITLTNSQNSPIANAAITVDLGTGAEPYITGANGQVKIPTAGLVPNNYTVNIAFEGNDNYMKSSSEAKVIVNKATPKLTAKAATFKKSLKTKKYTITLKNNKKKAMKKVKVTLKVNGKTYSAKTNSNGQATFKITKLTKKGKFTAYIKYNGNKYYNKLNKKVKITVK